MAKRKPKRTKRTKRMTACDCLEKVNQGLKKEGANTQVTGHVTIDFGKGRATIIPALAVEKADPKRREKPRAVLPTYCPFCGKKYPEAK